MVICECSHGIVGGGGQALSSFWTLVGGLVGGILALNVTLSRAMVHITHHSAAILAPLLIIWLPSSKF